MAVVQTSVDCSATHAEEETVQAIGVDQESGVPRIPIDQLEEQAIRLTFSRLMAAYLCLCACYFISYLDMNSSTTALPTIANALHAGTTITWTGTAYLLGQTTFQPLYGRVSDIVGRKPVLLASLLCIVVGDFLCGWAQNPTWLYGSRALSGIGGGGISSLVAIIVSDLVSLKDRGKYQGMISIAIGTGAMTGPFVAASLVGKGANGWRWVFWTPCILALCCFLVLLFALPLKPVRGEWRNKVRKIDWGGVLASTSGIILVSIPISSGGSIWSWRSPMVIALLIVGGLALVVFVLTEGCLAKIPIMPLHLFKQQSLTIMLISGAAYDYVWQATQYFMPLYFQEVCGFSPLKSAVLTLPYTLCQSLAGAASGPTMTRFARYGPVLRLGFILWTLGAGLNLLYNQKTLTAVYVIVLGIQGIGVGLVHQPGLVAVQALARTQDRAVATSTRNFLRCLGSVFGVAISTTIQSAIVENDLRSSKIPSTLLQQVLDGSWSKDASTTGAYQSDILDAKMKGYHVIFITLVPLMCICLVSNFFITDTVLQGDMKEKELVTT